MTFEVAKKNLLRDLAHNQLCDSAEYCCVQAAWYWTSPAEQQRRRTMFAKTLIATLILATTSVALTAKVYAGPKGQFDQHEQSYFDRASRVTDGGGL